MNMAYCSEGKRKQIIYIDDTRRLSFGINVLGLKMTVKRLKGRTCWRIRTHQRTCWSLCPKNFFRNIYQTGRHYIDTDVLCLASRSSLGMGYDFWFVLRPGWHLSAINIAKSIWLLYVKRYRVFSNRHTANIEDLIEVVLDEGMRPYAQFRGTSRKNLCMKVIILYLYIKFYMVTDWPRTLLIVCIESYNIR